MTQVPSVHSHLVSVILKFQKISNIGPVDFGMSYNGERLGAKFSQVLARF